MRLYKLECLYWQSLFQSSLTFAGNIKSLPYKEASEGAPIGLALALPSNSKTRLERVSKEKPSSLLGLVISDEGKKSPGVNVIKLVSFVANDEAK